MYFALLSTDGDYASTLAALPGYDILGDASHDSDLKIIAAYVDDSSIEDTSALSNLSRANYPNTLCRHCWENLNEFNTTGWHMLGQSQSSTEAAAGRSSVHVGQVSSGNADGTTYYDRYSYDTMDGTGLSNATTYVFHGKFWNARNTALNSTDSIAIATGGAATDAASMNIRMDAGRTPGLFTDGQDISQGTQYPTDLGWTSTATLFGTGTYVKASLCQPQSTVIINYRSLMVDVGGADPTTTTTVLEDSILERVATVGELSSEMTFYAGGRTSTNCAAAPFGAPDAAIQDDGGAFTDLTTEIGDATAADVPLFPASPVTGDAFYVGHTEVWSALELTMATAGVGTYVLAYEYWNGSTWAAIPSSLFHGDATGAWKSTSGYDADPRFIFNPPDDWATTSVNSQGPFYYIRFRYASGTMTTSPVADQGQTMSTFYVVHLRGGATPTTVLPGDGVGVGFGIRQATRPGQLQLINVNMLGCNNFITQFAGGNYLPSIFRIKGGRYLNGDNGYQNGQMDEWFIGAAEDRTPPWSTSDRAHYGNDADIRAHVDSFGFSSSGWSESSVTKFCEFKYLQVGPHYTATVSGGTQPGPPDEWPIDGLIIGKIGYDFKGQDRSAETGSNDMHGLAARARLDLTTASTWQRVLLDDGHAHIYFYITSDTTISSPINANVSDAGPLTLQNMIIRGTGTESPTAGIFGLRFGGDTANGNLQDNGQGVRTITLDGISMVDIQPAGGHDNESAFMWSWDQTPTIAKGMRFIRCERGVGAGGAGVVSKVYVVTEDNGTGFTDETANAYNGTTFNAFPATPTTDDAIYFGYKRWPFRSGALTIDTSGVGSGLTTVWEYWNGSSWGSLASFTDDTTELTAATGSRAFSFNRPTDWATTDDSGNLTYDVYWIRLRITAGTYSTVPQLSTCQGPRMGGWFSSTTAGKLYFEDMEGPWVGIIGLNASYDDDRRTVNVDRFTGRLKSGETISSFNMFWSMASGTDDFYTLSQVKAGSLDKALVDSDVIEAVTIAANVSTTPGVDIEEVP